MNLPTGLSWAWPLWRRAVLALGLVVVFMPNLSAQERTDEVPELPETVVPGRPGAFPAAPLEDDSVVGATGTASRRRDVGSSVTVIDPQEIENRQSVTVAEVLRGRVGLDVVRQGGVGGTTSVFLRGANSQQTKVIMDGIWLNDPSNPTRGFDFSNLTMANIERIEVIRGPQSILYGSDAIGGVVNIVTKRGEGPLTFRGSHQGGTLNSQQQMLHASGGDDRKYYSITGSYLSTSGISTASVLNGNAEHDGYQNGTIGGRFGWTPAPELNVDYVFRWTDARVDVDDFSFGLGVPIDNLIRKNLAKQFFQRVQLQSLAFDELIEQKVGFNVTDYHRRDTAPGPFEPATFLGQTRMVDYQANLQLTDTNRFTAGTMYWQEEASSSLDPQAALTDAAVFLMDEVRLWDRWTTSIGVRWDKYNAAGPAQTYRFASNYQLEEFATAIHGSLGTGFRAPSLAESLFAFGNPNLLPERSKGWDIGATKTFFDGIVNVDATYFRNDITDLIVFDFATFNLNNVGLVRTSGVELSGDVQLTRTTLLRGNYTHTDAINRLTDTQLLRRPKDKGYVEIQQKLLNDRATLSVMSFLVGPRLDTGLTRLDRYGIVNVMGRYQWTDQLELFGRIDNVFNERYEEVRGYGVLGLNAYAGVNWTW